ncbi:MAG TPA: hypothetical protein DEH25_08315 [Chloroflexi bacterium]|nr:hypothetical protein [Chloroflexota bacterium]HBY08404.1 hypothetical protein [Chloroflexota bacterium]
MSEKPIQFLIAVFKDEQGAENSLAILKTEKKESLQGVQAAVAMRKDAQGQIHYQDVGMTPAKGAAAGALLGAFVGVATGGIGLVLGGLGALLGGVVGKRKREGYITAEQVNQVVASLPAESSALLTVVESQSAANFEAALSANDAQIFSADISADLSAQLSEHGVAAHAALMSQLNP